MRYSGVVACLLLIFFTSLEAQIQLPLDGKAWRQMEPTARYYFLRGLMNGLEKAENIIDINVRKQRRKEFAFSEPFYVHQMRVNIRKYYLSPEIDLPILIELLNVFYTSPYNLAIPVIAAVRIVLARQQGNISQSDLWLKEARKQHPVD